MLSTFTVGGGIAAPPELLTSPRERHRGYLQTDAWRALRAAALEVHHRVYPRPWRPDRVEALTTLCAWWRRDFHTRLWIIRALGLKRARSARARARSFPPRLPAWSLAPIVCALRALRGVDLIVAATFVSEVGDIGRLTTRGSSWATSA